MGMAHAGRLVQTLRNNYASTAVTTASFVQILTACRTDVRMIEIFDSGGGEIVLGYGPAGAEQTAMVVPPGGTSGPTPIVLNAGMRLALKVMASSTPATVSSGVFLANLFL